MANNDNTVITIAENEVGYLEKSKTAYKNNPAILDKKTDGAGSDNYTKYGRDMHEIYPSVMDFPAAWCDAFVDWCFYKAYGIANAKALLGGDFNDYTVASASLYKKKNAWYTSKPKKGDQVFFLNDKGGICHTGLVYKVDSTRVYTIEGNTSKANGVIANGGGVAKKSYLLTYSKIAGYGRPKYDNTTNTTNSSTSSIPTLANNTLRKGDSGTEVKKLQKNLNYAINAGLIVDGKFGSATFKAVKNFQTKCGISVDGIYGPKTKQKMATFLK